VVSRADFLYDGIIMTMKNSHLLLILASLAAVGAAAIWYSSDRQAVSGLAPLAEKTSNAEMLKSDGLETVAEEVAYFEGAKGYYAAPAAEGAYPGVVMVHENRGLRPEIRATAEQLASAGYRVLAVDLLGGVGETQDDAKALTAKFDQQTGIKNMRAAAAFLREKGATKLASLGWCFGGRQSLELAMSGEPLDATVVYYGGGMATTVDRLKPIQWPVLGIFGDQDKAIPLETVKKFEASLDELVIENEIYIYPGVGHAFANPSGANYAPEPTKDAWQKTLTFLEKHLK
jgi:carboxymethylenebutenolidase